MELQKRKPEYAIPIWCQMPMEEHLCFGGCWGISSGRVAEEGHEYCKDCEYNEDNLNVSSGVR